MDSSSPTREARRLSNPGSQYSLDLAALEVNSRSGASTPLPEQQTDHVLSEDIDGPSDFTVNLEAWMKGGSLRKQPKLKSLKEESMQESAPHAQTEPGRSDHESIPKAESHRKHPLDEAYSTECSHNGYIMERSSDQHLNAEGQQTPQSAVGHFPHPMAEDRCNPVGPKYVAATHASESRGHHKPNPASTHSSPAHQSEPPPASHHFSLPGPHEHSEMTPRPAQRRQSSQLENSKIEEQFEELRAQCHRLQRLHDTLSNALEDERSARRVDVATHQAPLALATKHELDLAELKTLAHAQKEDLKHEFKDLKMRLQQHEDSACAQQRFAECPRCAQDDELTKLKEHIERQAQEHGREMRNSEQEVELARRGRDNAEETAKAYREQLEESRGVHGAEVTRLESELNRTGKLSEDVLNLGEQLGKAKQEKKEALDARKAAEEEASRLRAELSVIKQSSQEEATRLIKFNEHATELVADLQTQVDALQQKLEAQQATHVAELRASTAVTTSKPNHDLQTTLNDAILDRDAALDELKALQDDKQRPKTQARSRGPGSDDTQSLLNNAILQRESANDTIQSLQAELEALKLELVDLNHTNSAFDVRISMALKKREKFWRNELKKSAEERRVMARTLLRQWAREEVGIEKDGMQVYEFMFPRTGKATSKA